MAQSLSGANVWWARMRPDQPALVMPGDQLSHAAYKDCSDHVAAMLIDDGLAPAIRWRFARSTAWPIAHSSGVGGIVSRELLPRLARGKPSKPAVHTLYAGAHQTLHKVR